jgi:sensor domain CHASE-containing protein
MRGTFIVVILIAMLIAVWLVAKNVKTDNVDGVDRIETIQKAKDTTDIVDNAVKNMKKAME